MNFLSQLAPMREEKQWNYWTSQATIYPPSRGETQILKLQGVKSKHSQTLGGVICNLPNLILIIHLLVAQLFHLIFREC